MMRTDFLQLFVYVVLLTLITPPLGKFMTKVFQGEKTWLHKPLGWLETLIYRIGGVDEKKEMNWKTYATAFMAFHVIGFVVLMALQMLQAYLPLNPQNLPN